MQNQALPTAVLLHISQELSVALRSVIATIELLDEGSTVPFIARYRKEVTGNLDEVQIRGIEEKLEYFRELEERRKTVLETIESQGKLTPELRARSKRRSKRPNRGSVPAVQAEAPNQGIDRPRKGLEPLAQYIWDRRPGPHRCSNAATFVGGRQECRFRRRGAPGRAPHRRRMDQRECRIPQGGPRR